MAAQLSRRQILDAGVEGNQETVPFHRLPEEQSVRPLLAIHSSSQRSRTRSVVMTGKSFDASKTGSPFTFLVPT